MKCARCYRPILKAAAWAGGQAFGPTCAQILELLPSVQLTTKSLLAPEFRHQYKKPDARQFEMFGVDEMPQRKPRNPVISLVERAVLIKKWEDFARSGQIQVLIGESAPSVINYCGRMVFVALGCALTTGIDADDVDVRILLGTANALQDQVGLDELAFRPALINGVQAALRIADRVSKKVLSDEICKMELRLRVGHLNHSDFVEMYG